MAKKVFFIIGIILVLLLVGVFFFYFALAGKNYDSVYSTRTIKNPTDGLTLEQAVVKFDESFVYYLLYSVKAYNLHNPPLSADTPKLEMHVGDDIYNAEIKKGEIVVNRGAIEGEDGVLITTTEEAVKMVMDGENIQESFGSGKSTVELKGEKSTLFAKGYLGLYTELTGKSITGNIARIYLE